MSESPRAMLRSLPGSSAVSPVPWMVDILDGFTTERFWAVLRAARAADRLARHVARNTMLVV